MAHLTVDPNPTTPGTQTGTRRAVSMDVHRRPITGGVVVGPLRMGGGRERRAPAWVSWTVASVVRSRDSWRTRPQFSLSCQYEIVRRCSSFSQAPAGLGGPPARSRRGNIVRSAGEVEQRRGQSCSPMSWGRPHNVSGSAIRKRTAFSRPMTDRARSGRRRRRSSDQGHRRRRGGGIEARGRRWRPRQRFNRRCTGGSAESRAVLRPDWGQRGRRERRQ